MFFHRSEYIFLSKTNIQGYAIRRKGLMGLHSVNLEMMNNFKTNVLDDYFKFIKEPMINYQMTLTRNSTELEYSPELINH